MAQTRSESEQAKKTYLAFISYRHADNTEEDQQWATWLHKQLEAYEIPAELIGTKNERGEIIPSKIYRVFLDVLSLPADTNLSTAITSALDQSQFLMMKFYILNAQANKTKLCQSCYAVNPMLH